MTHIIKCKIENVLGAERIEFAPNGESVTIGGANGEGKSSAIWALAMALGGSRQIPQRPVKEGEHKGKVKIELEDLAVELIVDRARGKTLTVRGKDGVPIRSPQATLDKLFGHLSFDPGAFKAMPPEKQITTLLEIIKVDIHSMNNKIEAISEKRKEIAREIKVYKGKTDEWDLEEGEVPKLEVEPISIVSLMERIKAIESLGAQLNNLESLRGIFKNNHDEIQRLLEENKRIEIKAHERKEAIKALKAEWEFDFEDFESRSSQTAVLKEKLQSAEEHNKQIHRNQETLKWLADLQTVKEEHDLLTVDLDSAKKEKKKLLEKSELPIENLSFDGYRITYKGTIFEQISESEQWEVSTAIGFALNPKGILFMRNSGGLDKNARERVRERAASLGVQLFLEVVDDAEDVQILIEEGRVKEDRTKSSLSN